MSSVPINGDSRLGLAFCVLGNPPWKKRYVEKIQITLPNQSSVSALIPQETLSIPLFCLKKANVKCLKLTAREIHNLSLSATWVNATNNTKETTPISLDKAIFSHTPGQRYHIFLLHFSDGTLSAQLRVSDFSSSNLEPLHKKQEKLIAEIYYGAGINALTQTMVKGFIELFKGSSVKLKEDPLHTAMFEVQKLIKNEIEHIDEYDLDALLFRLDQLNSEISRIKNTATKDLASPPPWKELFKEKIYLIFTEIGGYPAFYDKLQRKLEEIFDSHYVTQPEETVKEFMTELFKLKKEAVMNELWEDSI